MDATTRVANRICAKTVWISLLLRACRAKGLKPVLIGGALVLRLSVAFLH
jgi:hypothetical protein